MWIILENMWTLVNNSVQARDQEIRNFNEYNYIEGYC